MKPIREILTARGLDPTEALVDLYEDIQRDIARINELMSASDSEEAKACYTPVKSDSQKLTHKVLKDLVTAKQKEDDQLLKIEEMNRGNKDHKGGYLGAMERVKLPDGRVIVKRIEIDAKAEGFQEQAEEKST